MIQIEINANRECIFLDIGSPDGISDRHVGAINGPRSIVTTTATENQLMSPNYVSNNVPEPHWVGPVISTSTIQPTSTVRNLPYLSLSLVAALSAVLLTLIFLLFPLTTNFPYKKV